MVRYRPKFLPRPDSPQTGETLLALRTSTASRLNSDKTWRHPTVLRSVFIRLPILSALSWPWYLLSKLHFVLSRFPFLTLRDLLCHNLVIIYIHYSTYEVLCTLRHRLIVSTQALVIVLLSFIYYLSGSRSNLPIISTPKICL
ncbi:hypothetical protein GGS21DRAFT_448305 [Xylaria nigripes]|nr:hypothetical protein GGS21DRAFT_448305 [Xylaria nigripes]